MRQAGDVLFSQVFRDRGGKFDKLFCPFIYPLYKSMNKRKYKNWAFEELFYSLAFCDWFILSIAKI
jgi:hypothetical protein